MPISVVQVLSPTMISVCQSDITEYRIGGECVQLALSSRVSISLWKHAFKNLLPSPYGNVQANNIGHLLDLHLWWTWRCSAWTPFQEGLAAQLPILSLPQLQSAAWHPSGYFVSCDRAREGYKVWSQTSVRCWRRLGLPASKFRFLLCLILLPPAPSHRYWS